MPSPAPPASPWLQRSLPLMPAIGMVASIGYVWNWQGAHVGMHPLLLFGLIQSIFFLIQTLLCLLYRPVPADRQLELPRVTVVVPAYNEGAMIRISIGSVAASDYPADRLEMVVVDDGSHDDTYAHMEAMAAQHPNLVHLIRLPQNVGKRAALYAGFRAAKGEILVTLDSDSVLEVAALRNLVAPLQQRPKIGAVAGRVAVLNRDGLMGRMLDVQFSLAFDFLRAAQSVTGIVSCCPGALTALRRAIIAPHLEAWAHQTFLGRAVAHGEDQALTNIVIAQGYNTCYQATAVVHTLVPETYSKLCRMLTRWDRSYIVESIVFARSLSLPLLRRGQVLAVTNFWLEHVRRLMLYVGLAELPRLLLYQPELLSRFFVAFLIGTTSSALYYLRSERSLRFLYGVLYSAYALFYLNWILPWALFTVRETRWGTR